MLELSDSFPNPSECLDCICWQGASLKGVVWNAAMNWFLKILFKVGNYLPQFKLLKCLC